MNAVAYVFPGQGAQEPGMGKDFCSSQLCRRAGEICGLDLASIMRDGPIERLQDSDVCQPALFLHSALVLEAMAGLGIREEPAYHLGLSLGEYTALYAAGVMSFEDAVSALSVRGKAMQQACRASEGGMVSVLGLDDAAVEKACEEARGKDVLQAANYNSPGQVVISGHKKALGRAEPLLKAAGAKRIIPLKVAGAFHSPLMSPARGPLSERLEKVRFLADPGKTLSNVSARPHTAAALVEMLLSQLVSPVRLAQSILFLTGEAGITTIREIGTGRIVSGLVRRTAPSCAVTSHASMAEVELLSPKA